MSDTPFSQLDLSIRDRRTDLGNMLIDAAGERGNTDVQLDDLHLIVVTLLAHMNTTEIREAMRELRRDNEHLVGVDEYAFLDQ